MKLGIAFCAALLAGASGAAWGQGRQAVERADANRDGVVSRAEMRAARAATFNQLDTDDDDFISEQERPQAGRRRAAGEFARADADGDGLVSRAEFVNQPMRGFDRFDADNSDALEPDELAAMRAALQRLGG